MSLDHFPDDPRDGSALLCNWRREGLEAASVTVTGELDRDTSGSLEQILAVALHHARLVLLNLQGVSFADGDGVHVIIRASVHARESGSRLLVVGAAPHIESVFTAPGAGAEIELLRTQPSPPARAARAADADTRIRPLDNPVNARVLTARVMAVDGPELWLHDSDGMLHRAWTPRVERASVPAGNPVEVYLDENGVINGWREPRSGLAINQRQFDRDVSAAVESAVVCDGPCGVVWRAAAAPALLEHHERCLTCAGPLSRTDPIGPLSGDALLDAVTDAMVALHLRYYSRVPATAKTQLLGGDLLACVLGGIYTDVEKTLIEIGRTVAVQETRGEFQHAMRDKFVDAVERLSGRAVVAFISNHHVGPDLAIELFWLDGQAEPQPL